MHEAPLEGVDEQMAALPAAAHLQQKLIGLGQAGEIRLALQQRFQGLQFWAVERALGAAVHFIAQLLAEQVGEGHLAAGPGGHGGALAGGGLHLSGHLPQTHELQLAAGEEEHLPRFEP